MHLQNSQDRRRFLFVFICGDLWLVRVFFLSPRRKARTSHRSTQMNTDSSLARRHAYGLWLRCAWTKAFAYRLMCIFTGPSSSAARRGSISPFGKLLEAACPIFHEGIPCV